VIYDPGGCLCERFSSSFKKNGYTVKVFNPDNISESVSYNPFEYIKDKGDDEGVPKLVSAIMNGTTGRGKRGDLRFLSLESTLLTALISYISIEAPSLERNLSLVYEMLNYMEPDENPDDYYDYQHAVDFLIDKAKRQNPRCIYVRRYEQYRARAGKDLKAVVKSCMTRLAPFGEREAAAFFSVDELGLKRLYNPQTALFVVPGESGVFDFLIPLLYTQIFDLMSKKSIEY
jgi:type IV secretion system protein VirD4